jgi:hypothetical protein
MTAFHDRANQQAGLASTRTALQNTGSSDNAEWLGDHAAMRADKAVRPTGAPKIGSARRIIGKQLLKLRERLGKSQIVALVDVHGRHDGQTLAIAGVCVNRIGTEQSSTTMTSFTGMLCAAMLSNARSITAGRLRTGTIAEIFTRLPHRHAY